MSKSTNFKPTPSVKELKEAAAATHAHMVALDKHFYEESPGVTAPTTTTTTAKAKMWSGFQLSDEQLAAMNADALREHIQGLPSIHDTAKEFVNSTEKLSDDNNNNDEPAAEFDPKRSPIHIVVVGNTRVGKSAFVRHILTAISGSSVPDPRVQIFDDTDLNNSVTRVSRGYVVPFGASRVHLIDTRGWSADPWQQHIDRTAGVVLGTTQIGHDEDSQDGDWKPAVGTHTPASLVVLVIGANELIGTDEQCQLLHDEKAWRDALNSNDPRYAALKADCDRKINEIRQSGAAMRQDLALRVAALRSILTTYGIPLRVVITKADRIEKDDVANVALVEPYHIDYISNIGAKHNAYVDEYNTKKGLLIMYRIMRDVFPNVRRNPAMLKAQKQLADALARDEKEKKQADGAQADGGRAEAVPRTTSLFAYVQWVIAAILVAIAVAFFGKGRI